MIVPLLGPLIVLGYAANALRKEPWRALHLKHRLSLVASVVVSMLWLGLHAHAALFGV